MYTNDASDSRPGLADAVADPFIGGQPLQRDGPARVEPAGGDADLGAQAHLAAVVEPGAGVDHHHGGVDAGGETVDNCQHILLRCCVNLQDFYRRVAATDKIEFHREFVFIEPGGQRSRMGAGLLPAPAHFTGSFLSLKFLDTAEKLAVARGLLAIRSEYGRRADLAEITMQQWLEEKRQPPRAVERFWRQILVSAVNEEMDRMAAIYGLQVFYLGFLASSDAYEMGVPAVPLGELYSSDVWSKLGVALHLRSQVTGLDRKSTRLNSSH